MPRVLTVDASRPEPEAIREAAHELAAGRLVAFPTETVYGLGADALDASAVARVFEAKGRPADDPIIVHVLGPDGLSAVSPAAPVLAFELAAAFWPGPLTLVVPRGPDVPKVVTAGLDSVAVRAPAHAVARALLREFGGPIAAPSANPFGLTSPTTAAHVSSALGDRVGLVLDAGPTEVGVESTVLDCRVEPPIVLRPGGVTLEQLAPWSAKLATAGPADRGGARPSPGQMARHYAPRALLVLVRPAGGEAGHPVSRLDSSGAEQPGAEPSRPETVAGRLVAAVLATAARRLIDDGLTVGILAADDDAEALAGLATGARVRLIGPLRAPETVARNLFGAVHDLDGAGVDVILARGFGRVGMALAIEDRLTRAAEGRVIEVSADLGSDNDSTDLGGDSDSTNLGSENDSALGGDNETAATAMAAAVIRLVEEASAGRRDRPS